jgi:hypothetical protein
MKYKFENYTLDEERRELLRDGIIRSVEPQVFDLLHFLIKNADRVVSRENIFQAVWRGRIGCGAGHAHQRGEAGDWRRWDPTAINQNIAA